MSGYRPALALATVAAGVLAAGLPATVFGQDANPHTLIDVLEMALEEVSGGTPSYDSLGTIGDEAIEIGGLVLPVSDGTEVRIDRLVVERVEIASISEVRLPWYLDATITGLHLPAVVLEELYLADLGYDTLTADIDLDWTSDLDARSLSLNEASIHAPSLGRLSLAFSLDDVSADAADEPWDLRWARLVSLHLSYEDDGFLAKLVEAGIEEGGTVEGTLFSVAQAIGMLFAILSGEVSEPTLRQATSEIFAFTSDYPDPSGTLTIAIEPGRPVPLPMLIHQQYLDRYADALNSSVEYVKP